MSVTSIGGELSSAAVAVPVKADMHKKIAIILLSMRLKYFMIISFDYCFREPCPNLIKAYSAHSRALSLVVLSSEDDKTTTASVISGIANLQSYALSECEQCYIPNV